MISHENCPSRQRLGVRCEFCRKTFTKEIYKFQRTSWDACKACNGVSSAYNKIGGGISRSNFYKAYSTSLQKFSAEICLDNPRFVLVPCDYCLIKYKARKDSIFNRKMESCLQCHYYDIKYKNSDKSVSKHQFYLNVRSVFESKIQIDKTKEIYGYDPLRISIQSKNKVISTCEFCAVDVHISISAIEARFTSIYCDDCSSLSKSFERSKTELTKSEYYKYFLENRVPDYAIEKTKNLLGYDPSWFSLGDKRHVAANCSFCDIDIIVSARQTVLKKKPFCEKCRSERIVDTCMREYGVSTINSVPKFIAKMSDPWTNRTVESIIKNRYGIDYVREFSIKNISFDFYIPSAHLLIECQGDFFHRFPQYGYSGTPRDVSKTTYIAKHTDYKLTQIWEHEIQLGRTTTILDKFLTPSDRVFQSEVNIEQISFRSITRDEMNQFLAEFNYVETVNINSSICGAFIGDKLISVTYIGLSSHLDPINAFQKFTSINLNKTNIGELKIFCIDPKFNSDVVRNHCFDESIRLLMENTKIYLLTSPKQSPSIEKSTNFDWQPSGVFSNPEMILDPKTHKILRKKEMMSVLKKTKMDLDKFMNLSGILDIRSELIEYLVKK